jgi:RimJ/RimL family protein N-acetyltransferase
MLAALGALPEVTRWVGDGSVWSPARAEEVAGVVREHWERHGFGWRAAVERASGSAIGFIMLNRGEGVPALEPDDHEVGWWLHPSAWGRGYAREGALALREEAFALGAPSVVARIQPPNAASIAVAVALGMVAEREAAGRFGERLVVYRSAACSLPGRDRVRASEGKRALPRARAGAS